MGTRSEMMAKRIGWALSLLTVAVLVGDAATGLFAPATLAPEMAATGWTIDRMPVVALITLACALVYAIPRTAVLGAILVSGFAGGALATHVRVDAGFTAPMLVCLAIAALAWGGLWLRDGRLATLLPAVR